MDLKIVFENEQVLVVDKPSGLVVNRSETIKDETLQDQLAKYFKLSKADLGIGDLAGIVHRLDRETSGLLLVAKTQESFDFLQKQFAEREVKKEYLALVHGKVEADEGSINFEIRRIGKFGKFGALKKRESGGRETLTNYQIISRYKFDDDKFQKLLLNDKIPFTKSRINYLKNHAREYTYLNVEPLSGRTHQIRVALKHIGHPVVSDLIYAPAKLLKFDLSWCERLFLHASRIEFIDPKTKKKVEFTLNLPNDLKNAMLNLD